MKVSIQLCLFLSILCLISSKTESQLTATDIEIRILYKSNGEWQIVTENFDENVNYVATAIFNPSAGETGWDFLHITTNSLYSDALQAEAAGRLEGYLTTEQIYAHYINLASVLNFNEQVVAHFQAHEDFLKNIFKTNLSDPHVYNAYLIYTQFDGIRKEYNSRANSTAKIDNIVFYMLPAFGEMIELEHKYSSNKKLKDMTTEELREFFLFHSHCSAIFKANEDFSEVYVGHNMWYDYAYMTRIFKEYNLNFNHPSVKAKNVMLSSYPAALSSNDDFYLTSQDLAVIETTNVIYNDTLYDLMKPESFMTWERVMIANRMSETSEEWGDHFKEFNSGTYNNMYMALDMKKIKLENNTIEDKTLYTIEQIPELVKINDVTDHLRYGYWPSYNAPYDREIIERSMIKEAIEKDPVLARDIDYDMCTRATIFRRDQGTINSLESFKRIMRYNNYTEDPLAFGDPTNSLTARGDLKEKPSCFGTTDAKLGLVSGLKGNNKTVHIINGPPYEDVEPFVFSKTTACDHIKHVGMKDEMKFDWVVVNNKYQMKDY